MTRAFGRDNINYDATGRAVRSSSDTPNQTPQAGKNIKKWKIHNTKGDTSKVCENCASLDGTTYTKVEGIPKLPVHPNCKCYIENIEVYLTFDGTALALMENKTVVDACYAMSGKEDYQGEEFTGVKNKGPLPAGTYTISPSNVQRRKDYSFIKRYTSWPGGEDSWGNERIWLTPDKENDMKGRDGFSIHGGTSFGSSGCIDLAGSMSEFLDVFEEYDTELELRVRY
ncbi:MAG: DUF2778 domain-containing protein [Alphaproteobacteria bacterium]|nr:DUF2778 domain-containing protein [Alphaproteobacteria bacterium]